MFTSLNEMADWEELVRFIVGLAGEITNNAKRGLQNVGQSYTNQLEGLLTVISAQGLSQIVDSFDGKPTKFRDWIKSVEKYVLLAAGDDNQSKRLAYQMIRGVVMITVKGIWLSIQKIVGNNSNLS